MEINLQLIILTLVCCCAIRYGEGASRVGKLKKMRQFKAGELASFQWPSDQRPVDTDYVVKPYESGATGGDAFLKWSRQGEEGWKKG